MKRKPIQLVSNSGYLYALCADSTLWALYTGSHSLIGPEDTLKEEWERLPSIPSDIAPIIIDGNLLSEVNPEKNVGIESEFIDKGYGFDVVIKDCPMTEIRNIYTPNINYNELEVLVVKELSKRSELSAAQKKFLAIERKNNARKV